MLAAPLILLIACIALDVAAMRWGVTSTDGLASQEWERRQAWIGFH